MRPYVKSIVLGGVLLWTGFCLFMAVPDMKPQPDRTFVRQGNRLYHAGKWTAAETMYRKAVSANPENAQALYNLGCALMQQQKDSLAVETFRKSGRMERGSIRKSKSYHNAGVVFEKHQQYAQAIPMYEEALRNHPSDDETRYNLALCQRLLKNQPQNQNNKNQKKQNQQNKNKNKENQQNKNQQNQNQNKNQNQNQQQNRQNANAPKMSRQNAEQLLNAAIQQEQATKDKLQKNMVQPRRKQLDKNW